MRISSFLLSAGLCAAASLPRRDDSACTNPRQRLEWRALSDDVKKQYTDSVLCLKTKPSQLGLDTSRYDDFPYIHTHLDRSSTYRPSAIRQGLCHLVATKANARNFSPLSGDVPPLAQAFRPCIREFPSRLWLHWPNAVRPPTSRTSAQPTNLYSAATGTGPSTQATQPKQQYGTQPPASAATATQPSIPGRKAARRSVLWTARSKNLRSPTRWVATNHTA